MKLSKLFRSKPKKKSTRIQPGTHISDDTIIGEHSYIGSNCSITKTRIGRYVSIANNVSIGQGEHDLSRASTSSLFYDSPYETLTAGECVIESDVWIAVDSIIRRGVTIGTGAVVGANSFVNKDVPPFAIVAGSPAKIIGYRLDEDKRAALLASRWWEQDLTEARHTLAVLEAEWAGEE